MPETRPVKTQAVRLVSLLSLSVLFACGMYLLFGGPLAGLDRVFLSSVLYGLCISLPAAVLLPRTARRFCRAGRALPAILGVCIIFCVLLGCLVAGGVLVALGLARPDQFWTDFVTSAKIGAMAGLVFGLSIFAYEGMRDRLESAQLQLHQKELAEERALKLAAEARLSSLESRIHPHFLFNTLNSISALIARDPNRAEQIVGSLAALLRASLDSTRRQLIPLGEELRIVEDYLAIEKARFGDRIRFAAEVAPGCLEVPVPAMSVHSLVENAIKHAVAPSRTGASISVRAGAGAGGARIEVADDGPGFDLSSVPEGHGIDNLVSRLDALYGPSARLEVRREQGLSIVAMVLPLAGSAAA